MSIINNKIIPVGFFCVSVAFMFSSCPTPTTDAPKSTVKAITAFGFTSPAATGVITEATHTIAITVPSGTAVTALMQIITQTGTSISPASGASQDFSLPATYTVTAEDGTTQSYQATVTAPAAPALLDEEFTTFDTSIWTAAPSLTPHPGCEGSSIPGEVKVEGGLLELSRYAWELFGQNGASAAGTTNPVNLPSSYTATSRFKNELIAFGFGNIAVCIYIGTIAVGHAGLEGAYDGNYA